MPAFKLIIGFKRRPDIDRATFQKLWRETHPKVIESVKDEIGLVRYVQNVPDDSALGFSLARMRGFAFNEYDGVGELWFQSESRLLERLGDGSIREAMLKLIEADSHIVDPTGSTFLFVREEPVF